MTTSNMNILKGGGGSIRVIQGLDSGYAGCEARPQYSRVLSHNDNGVLGPWLGGLRRLVSADSQPEGMVTSHAEVAGGRPAGRFLGTYPGNAPPRRCVCTSSSGSRRKNLFGLEEEAEEEKDGKDVRAAVWGASYMPFSPAQLEIAKALVDAGAPVADDHPEGHYMH